MRYTTVIDITEMPAIYKSRSATLVYLHLALKAGYHDHDRDLCDKSVRAIAADLGLTLSATRHALSKLEKAQLIKHQGSLWMVRKWIAEQPITGRAKTAQEKKQLEAAAERKAANEQREREAEIEQIRRENLAAQGKNSFMLYYEEKARRAAAGDPDAARIVAQRKAQYDANKKFMEQKQR